MRSNRKVLIDTQESLKKTTQYYHDGQFNMENVIYDKGKRVFSIEYWRRIFDEHKRKKDYIIYQVNVSPIVRSKLSFHNVQNIKITGDFSYDVITSISYDSTTYEICIFCANNTKITMKATKLDGSIQDISERYPEAYKYRTFLYWIEIHGMF